MNLAVRFWNLTRPLKRAVAGFAVTAVAIVGWQQVSAQVCHRFAHRKLVVVEAEPHGSGGGVGASRRLSEAETLIRAVAGVEYVPLEKQDQCCGFGGSFAVRYPEISGAMVGDKVACVSSTGADVLVSTDTGCLMNIGGALHRQNKPVRVMHLAELLECR